MKIILEIYDFIVGILTAILLGIVWIVAYLFDNIIPILVFEFVRFLVTGKF